ncbi:MAG: T9SS type A sorting domain-containing protein [Candidatus Zixiibacteriota bacterium]|nr:MAG: T9SS type A sorting domain-containing protein [candidate division Zixibacteria bacterium]
MKCLFLSTWMVATATLLASPAMAGIELNHVLTIDIPDLNGGVQELVLEDINGDGYPEVAGADSLYAYLYSLIDQQMLMKQPLDTGWQDIKIMVGDVNRDSVADVVVAQVDNLWQLKVMLYDGASDYQFAGAEEYAAYPFAMGWNPWWDMFDVAIFDFDHDGYDELIVAYDSTWDFSYWWSYTEGTTLFYYSFPDSIRHHEPRHLWDFFELYEDAGGTQYAAHDLYHRMTDMPGVNSEISVRSLRGIVADGSTYELLEVTKPSHCDSYQLVTVINSFRLGTVINSGVGPSVVGEFRYYSACHYYDGPEPYRDELSERSLVMYELQSPGLPVQQWTDSLSGDTLTDFLYHSRFSESFFAFQNDRLDQYSLTNGQKLRSTQVEPADMRLWYSDFPGYSPLLVQVNYQTVKLYSLDVNTASPDDNQPAGLPTSFALSPPYPNPFNPNVSVTLSMPMRGDVTVEVFNVLGRRVDLLHDGQVPAGETHLTWDAARFSSGIYLIRATLGPESRTVKAVLVK